MIEIIALVLLSNYTCKIAAARGRSALSFRVLTIALWLSLEFAGFAIGLCRLPSDLIHAYLCGFLAAMLGGLVSVIAAHTCRPGSPHPGLTPAEATNLPSTQTPAGLVTPPQAEATDVYPTGISTLTASASTEPYTPRAYRALWAQAGLLLLMLVGMFTPMGHNLFSAVFILFNTALGVGAYTLAQKQAWVKAAGGAVLFITTICVLVASAFITGLPLSQAFGALIASYDSIFPAVKLGLVIITAVVVGLIVKQDNYKKYLILAGSLAAIIFLSLVPMMLSTFGQQPDTDTQILSYHVFRYLLSAISPSIYVLIAFSMCQDSPPLVINRTGTRVWLILAAIIPVVVTIIYFGAYGQINEFVLTLAAFNTAGHLMLLASKRSGLAVIAIVTTITVMEFIPYINGSLPEIFSPLTLFIPVFLLITWVALNRSWYSPASNTTDSQLPGLTTNNVPSAKPKYSLAFKTGAILNIAIPITLVVAMLAIPSIRDVVHSGYTMTIALLFGTCFAIGSVAGVELVSPNMQTHTAIQIVSTITGSLITVIAAFSLLMLLLS